MAERNLAVPISSELPNREDFEIARPVSREVCDAPDGAHVNEPSEGLAENAQTTIERGMRTVGNSLEAAEDSVVRSARSAFENLRRLANERPLHFMGVVAGAAFVAGVALRIWRSRYE